MDAGADGDVAGLSDSFLAHGQYVVEDGQDEDGDQDQSYQESSTPFRDQDRFLPIANVNRIMKKSIPKSGKIAKDAKECVQECVSEFISFITSEASERCHQEKRKTINGEDILFAMSTLGFDNYVEPLKQYLQKYRETLHQTNTKAEKAMETTSLEELTAEDAFTTTLTSNILGECAPQGVIYTTAYQPQMTQQLNLG